MFKKFAGPQKIFVDKTGGGPYNTDNNRITQTDEAEENQ